MLLSETAVLTESDAEVVTKVEGAMAQSAEFKLNKFYFS